MAEIPSGWELLHAALPKAALKPLNESVYGVAGLTDVNEGYLIQRLFASTLLWEWRIVRQEYLGSEDRKSNAGKDYRVYLASVQGVLNIDGREFHGAGAHDNKKLDAAFKGAATVAFKNACKVAGLTAELFLNGKAMDFIYADTGTGAEPPQPTTQANSSAPSSAPPPELDEMVCEKCGESKALRPLGNPRYCQKKPYGGCGAPAAGDAWKLIPRAQWEALHVR